MSTAHTDVRFAVYALGDAPDLEGVLKGYKSDTFWSLNPDAFKMHPAVDAAPDKHLFSNLLYILNVVRSVDKPPVRLRVDVETFTAGKSVRAGSGYAADCPRVAVVASYTVEQNTLGVYTVADRRV